jgi:hypothetical protein
MTINVNSTTETVSINNSSIPATVDFILTSGYSKEPVILSAVRTLQNNRYSTIDITFPADFKDQHKNGVYYYAIKAGDTQYEAGFAKIITEPGGETGITNYTSTPATENREADVYFRPNY